MVKHGRKFRNTDVGRIPHDWEVCELSSLLSYGPKNGYSPRVADGLFGTLTLTLSATSQGSLVLNDDTVKRVVEEIDPESELFLRPGDVLVQRANTPELVGTTAIFDGPPGTYIYPDLMMRIRFDDETTSQWFWRYANSSRGRDYFRRVATGSSSSMPKISGAKLRRMLIPLPPKSERSRIAEVIADFDALLASINEVLTKKSDIFTGVLQQLISGRTRLPGFARSEAFQSFSMGSVPADWGIARTGSFTTIETGAKDTKDRVDDGDYPFFVRSQNVERIDTYSFDGEAVLTAGDGVGTGKVFHYIHGKFDYHQRVYCISHFHDDLDGYYFYLHFRARFRDRIMSMTAKSSVDSVRMEMIADMELPLPSIDEQRAIAKLARDFEKELSVLRLRREKTEFLRQAVLQELLSGRRQPTDGGNPA